jgi:hypothetical protein
MTKSLFINSMYALCMSAAIISINACKKATDQTPAKENEKTSPLLTNPAKGQAFSSGNINDFVLAEKDQQVFLLAANNTTGKVYAIDLEDHDASKASANTITTPVASFGDGLALKMGVPGSQLTILNMEINPVSKSIYLLVMNTSNNTSSVVRVTDQGKTFTTLDLSNVSYIAMPFSIIGENVNDMTWGDNSLFISYSNASTLVGKVSVAQAPFVNNAAMTSRATTVFKTNWGNNYFTNAPLETMCYAEIGGEKRLLGVTVCAPGFSIKTNSISQGTGLLEVREYFNLNTGYANKVYPVTKNGKTYLIEHHYDGRITMVGEKYLDESQTKFNTGAKQLLQGNGTTVVSGLTDDDVKILVNNGTYIISAKNSNMQLLAFNVNGSLALIDY